MRYRRRIYQGRLMFVADIAAELGVSHDVIHRAARATDADDITVLANAVAYRVHRRRERTERDRHMARVCGVTPAAIRARRCRRKKLEECKAVKS